MTERALQIRPYPRQVTQVLRLAVAHIQPCKYAEDFARALGGKRHVHLDELGGIKVGIRMPAAAHIAAEKRELDLLRYIDPRILQERSHIVGRGTHHGVLKIQETEPGGVAAPGQP